MKTDINLEKQLSILCRKGILEQTFENNQYLKVAYKGTEKLISSKWNIKIYTSGSVVCNDVYTLEKIMLNQLKEPDNSLKVIQIDDAGWGFPLLGVMVGVTDGEKVITDTIDVSFFQGSLFKSKEYLQAYALKGLNIVQDVFKANPAEYRIEICTGFINRKLKDLLRIKKFDVKVTEIKGLLQDQLELKFKNYVKETLNNDLAYDPKELKNEGKNIGTKYYDVLNWGKENVPHLLKSGWKSMKDMKI